MLRILVACLREFMPVSVLSGMLVARWLPGRGTQALRAVIGSLAAGILGGIAVYSVSLQQETVTAARTVLHGAAGLACAFSAGALFLPDQRSPEASLIGRSAALVFLAIIAALATFSLLAEVGEQTLSAVSVLNTDLILSSGGILAAAVLIALLIPLTAHLSATGGNPLVSGCILLVAALLVLQSGAAVLLGLMRLDIIGPTSGRLSFVAKVAKHSAMLPYVHAVVVVALSLSFFFFARRTTITPSDTAGMQKAQRRKAHSQSMVEMRWFESALLSVAIVLVVLVYHDVHASRPPRISPPLRLAPDASGLIKVKSEDVGDGKLHRYSYVTDDGHVVRFFLVNRSRGQSKIGVVYDACMLCGDMGYNQEGDDILCIACNVRIFIPSIGKAGGCNPIPLEHTVEGQDVVIHAAELDKGARYFSEVISVVVKDPVTGKELTNLAAPYRYEYKGRTYFFESHESGEKFRESPEKYVGEQESRYERVEGYRES